MIYDAGPAPAPAALATCAPASHVPATRQSLLKFLRDERTAIGIPTTALQMEVLWGLDQDIAQLEEYAARKIPC